VDHPLPWLKYVEADEVGDELVDFDGMNVESRLGEVLGTVDGFIVDSETGRPYYVVTDAGGWFKSRHFLLPVGHARLDAERETLVSDVPKSRVERFPGFNKSEFATLGEQDIKRLNDETCVACAIESVAVVYSDTERYSAAWERPHYRYPDWWRSNPSLPSRMGASAVTAGATYEPASDEPASAEADPSPHMDGRAQPGDVIGVETGGEQTHIGETGEDENRRRREAERSARR
jgi:hypothetical protein